MSEAYEVLSDETKRKNYDTYGMSGSQFGAGGDPFAGASARAGNAGPGGFQGYEYYQSQVDPEELFRKIFGDAFSRGGFGNHEWASDGQDGQFGRQGITQVISIVRTFVGGVDSCLVVVP